MTSNECSTAPRALSAREQELADASTLETVRLLDKPSVNGSSSEQETLQPASAETETSSIVQRVTTALRYYSSSSAHAGSSAQCASSTTVPVTLPSQTAKPLATVSTTTTRTRLSDDDSDASPRICRFCLEEESEDESEVPDQPPTTPNHSNDFGQLPPLDIESQQLITQPHSHSSDQHSGGGPGGQLQGGGGRARGLQRIRQWWLACRAKSRARKQQLPTSCHPPNSQPPNSRPPRPRTNPLIAPCMCTGTGKYVHQDCLQKWRESTPAAFYSCTICGHTYEFKGGRTARFLSNPLTPACVLVMLLAVACYVLGFLPSWRDPGDSWLVHFMNGFVLLGLMGFGITLADIFSSRRAMSLLQALNDGQEVSSTLSYCVVSMFQLVAVGMLVSCLIVSNMWTWGVVVLAVLGCNHMSCGPLFRGVKRGMERMAGRIDMSTSRMIAELAPPRSRRRISRQPPSFSGLPLTLPPLRPPSPWPASMQLPPPAGACSPVSPAGPSSSSHRHNHPAPPTINYPSPAATTDSTTSTTISASSSFHTLARSPFQSDPDDSPTAGGATTPTFNNHVANHLAMLRAIAASESAPTTPIRRLALPAYPSDAYLLTATTSLQHPTTTAPPTLPDAPATPTTTDTPTSQTAAASFTTTSGSGTSSAGSGTRQRQLFTDRQLSETDTETGSDEDSEGEEEQEGGGETRQLLGSAARPSHITHPRVTE